LELLRVPSRDREKIKQAAYLVVETGELRLNDVWVLCEMVVVMSVRVLVFLRLTEILPSGGCPT
jgi:hypothetical protein